MVGWIQIKRTGRWRDEDATKVVISGELKMIDRIEIKRIGRWRNEDAIYKFVKGANQW
jgi:hypothetical protein